MVVLFLFFSNWSNSTKPIVTSENVAKIVAEASKTVIQPKRNYRIVVNKNDVVIKEKVTLPFNPAKSVNLDGYLKNKRRLRGNSINAPGRFVSERQTYFEFPGFIPVEENQKVVNKLKAQIDSLEGNGSNESSQNNR